MSLIHELIGNTPLVRLQRSNANGRVFVKLESKNPGGSVKDRIGLQMVKDLLETGKITKDTVLIEPTSGNTGIGLCLVCASLGIKLKIIMPETMSQERKSIMKAYGAELILTEGPKGMKGAIAKAEEIHKEITNSYIVGQFVNPSNPKAHVLTTGPELLEQIEKYDIKPKYFVVGVGTGGTITGCSQVLKQKYPEIQVIAVEPKASPVLSGGMPSPHKIQGIGAGFVPDVLNLKAFDKVELADHVEAYSLVRQLATTEGLLVGISSAAAIQVAIKYADEHGADVIVIAADSGERYLSVEGLF